MKRLTAKSYSAKLGIYHLLCVKICITWYNIQKDSPHIATNKTDQSIYIGVTKVFKPQPSICSLR